MMREFVRRVGANGKITVPAELRHRLGIKAGDEVSLRVEGDGICVRPVTFSLAEVCGSVVPLNGTDDLDAIEREVKEEKADREVRGLTGR